MSISSGKLSAWPESVGCLQLEAGKPVVTPEYPASGCMGAWSIAHVPQPGATDGTGYVYASPPETGVAAPKGVTQAWQIDAAALDYSSHVTGQIGLGDFAVLRLLASGEAVALRFDSIYPTGSGALPLALGDFSWWYQPDGTGNFGGLEH